MKPNNSNSMISAALVALVAGATMLLAQWPKHPTDGPRTEDGKLDMKGPTPRTADGHPDFSGLWQPARGGGFGRGNAKGKGGPGRGPGGAAPAPGAQARGAGDEVAAASPAPAPPPRGPAAPPLVPGQPPVAQFNDVGQGFPNGLPFTEWGRKVRDDRKANNSKDNPDANCRPLGLMQLHTHPYEKKIVQGKDAMVIMYNANNDVRQILLNSQPLPQVGPDLAPWYYGYSVGKWEGDTLVVTTVGFRDDVWLDVNGSPLTSTGKLVERFTRPNFGTLQIDVTISDPKAYTEPFTVRVNQQIMADTELFESVCEDRDARHYVGDADRKEKASDKK